MASETAIVSAPATTRAVEQLGLLADWLGEGQEPLTDKLDVWASALLYGAFPPATIAAEIRAEASGWYDYSHAVQSRLLDCAQSVDDCAAAESAV